MKLLRLLAPFCLLIASFAMAPNSYAQTGGCQYILGFKSLHDLAPADVGDCTDNQAFAANGDAQQHTSKGLMAWRKADNWTAFTNGYTTWINSPFGLANRLNTQRFSFEADYAQFTLVAAPGQLICKDGFPWPSPVRQGACSGHGGIAAG